MRTLTQRSYNSIHLVRCHRANRPILKSVHQMTSCKRILNNNNNNIPSKIEPRHHIPACSGRISGNLVCWKAHRTNQITLPTKLFDRSHHQRSIFTNKRQNLSFDASKQRLLFLTRTHQNNKLPAGRPHGPRASSWTPLLQRLHVIQHMPRQFCGGYTGGPQPGSRLTEQQMAEQKYPQALANSTKALDMLIKSDEVGPQGNEAKIFVTGYNDEAFQLNDQLVYPAPICSFPNNVFFWKVPEKFSEFGMPHFRVLDLIVPEPQLALVGTGDRTRTLPAHVTNYFLSKGIVLETMKTGAACNTFNTLNSESRSVVLFAVPNSMLKD